MIGLILLAPPLLNPAPLLYLLSVVWGRVGAVGDVVDEIAEHVQQEFPRSWYSIHAASLLHYG